MVLSAGRVFKVDLFILFYFYLFIFFTAAASKALHRVVFFAWLLRARTSCRCLPSQMSGWGTSWFPVSCSPEQTAVLVGRVPEPTTRERQRRWRTGIIVPSPLSPLRRQGNSPRKRSPCAQRALGQASGQRRSCGKEGRIHSVHVTACLTACQLLAGLCWEGPSRGVRSKFFS